MWIKNFKGTWLVNANHYDVFMADGSKLVLYRHLPSESGSNFCLYKMAVGIYAPEHMHRIIDEIGQHISGGATVYQLPANDEVSE